MLGKQIYQRTFEGCNKFGLRSESLAVVLPCLIPNNDSQFQRLYVVKYKPVKTIFTRVHLFGGEHTYLTSGTDLDFQIRKRNARLLHWAKHFNSDDHTTLFITLTSANAARFDIRMWIREYKRAMHRKNFIVLGYAWVLEFGTPEIINGSDPTRLTGHPHYHVIVQFKKLPDNEPFATDMRRKLLKFSYLYSSLFWGLRTETQIARKPKEGYNLPSVGYLLKYFNKKSKCTVLCTNWRNYGISRI